MAGHKSPYVVPEKYHYDVFSVVDGVDLDCRFLFSTNTEVAAEFLARIYSEKAGSWEVIVVRTRPSKSHTIHKFEGEDGFLDGFNPEAIAKDLIDRFDWQDENTETPEPLENWLSLESDPVCNDENCSLCKELSDKELLAESIKVNAELCNCNVELSQEVEDLKKQLAILRGKNKTKGKVTF